MNCAGSAAATLELVETFGTESSNFTPRGGIATGPVLARGGDFFAPVVNLAGRIAEVAAPAEVLVAASIRKALDDKGLCSPAGRRMLEGFPEPVELGTVMRP